MQRHRLVAYTDATAAGDDVTRGTDKREKMKCAKYDEKCGALRAIFIRLIISLQESVQDHARACAVRYSLSSASPGTSFH